MSKKPVFFKLKFAKVNPDFLNIPDVEIHARHDGIYERMTPKIAEPEFEGYIDLLINELEIIRKEGKRKYASIKK
jgi:hypothetical protein